MSEQELDLRQAWQAKYAMSQNSPITLALYYQVGFLRSSRQAKLLGGDVILYAVTKRVLRDSEGESATLGYGK